MKLNVQNSSNSHFNATWQLNEIYLESGFLRGDSIPRQAYDRSTLKLFLHRIIPQVANLKFCIKTEVDHHFP